MRSVSIELGDTEYELEVVSFRPPTPDTRWEPGDGGEIELGDTVKVWGLVFKETGPGSGNAVPGVVDRIHYDEFLRLFAEHEDLLDMEKADRRLHEICLDDVCDQLADEFDDSECDD